MIYINSPLENPSGYFLLLTADMLQIFSIGDSGGEGNFIGVFDITACGQSSRNAGDFDIKWLELLFEVECGEVALGGGVGSKDNFGDVFVLDTLQELGDVERACGGVFFDRLHHAAQNMVAPLETTRAFDSDNIEGLFDDAEDGHVASCVEADTAKGRLSNVKTLRANLQSMNTFEALCKVLEFVLVLFKKIQNESLRHFWPDRWQGCEMLNKFFKRFWIHSFCNSQS